MYMKPVKLSTFLSKQKLLGLGDKTVKDVTSYIVDENVAVQIIKFGSESSLNIVAVATDFRVADYFTDLDTDCTLSMQAKPPKTADSKTSISLRGVHIPKELRITDIVASKVDFGDDINLVELLNNGGVFYYVTDLENNLVFNKRMSGKLLKNPGCFFNLDVYNTETLGVSEITLWCLIHAMPNRLTNLKKLDISSIHNIVVDRGCPLMLEDWFETLKEVYVSRELVYLVIQLLCYTHLQVINAKNEDECIWYDNKLYKSKKGVYKLTLGVHSLKGGFTPNYKGSTNKRLVSAIGRLKKDSMRNYKVLLRNKKVYILNTKVILKD